MAPDDPALQVLAITDNHALVIGLTFLGRPWDVTAHLDPDDVDATRADVLVVDLGTTQAALDALMRFIERPAAVVIGTDPVDLAPADVFIPRPFTLDELAAAIDTATTEPPGVAKLNRGSAETTTPSGATWVATRSPTLDPVSELRSGQPAGFWVVPGWALDDVDAGHEVIDLAALEREGPARDDAGAVTPARRAREPGAAELRPGPLERIRAMATRTRDTVALDPTLQRDAVLHRFAQGVAAGAELEKLLVDMPILGSIRSLGTVIVAEVHAELEADTTAYWQRFDDGFRVLASQGLTKVEQHLVVALDQPLLGEIHATGGGLLIDPVDTVQAAVAGIGGAHTESFMAAAIAVGEGRYGILAVGRNRPLVPDDLDRLIAIATEAAPGIALAQLLRRVTGQVVLPAVHREQDVFADERTQTESRFGHADA